MGFVPGRKTSTSNSGWTISRTVRPTDVYGASPVTAGVVHKIIIFGPDINISGPEEAGPISGPDVLSLGQRYFFLYFMHYTVAAAVPVKGF